jgi:23S rRNA A1618 N6-methylase RlmF
MAKSFGSTLGRELLRGFGRQVGFRSARQLEKEVAKKVIDPNSKFRKYIQKFELPGNPKSAIQKLWTLIDGFEEEYLENKSLFQSNYKIGDIEFIQKKLDRVQQMKLSDNELDSFEHLTSIWDTIKIK